MTNYILRRLIYMLVVLFTVAGITFILMHAVPGGPFDKEKNLPPEIQANKEKYYNLDDPLPVQFFSYLSLVTTPARRVAWLPILSAAATEAQHQRSRRAASTRL